MHSLFYKLVVIVLVAAFCLSSCAQPTPTITAAPDNQPPLYLDPQVPADQRAADLLSRMTLDEKIGQMTLIEKNSIRSDAVREFLIGGVLSGGGGSPQDNTPEGWRAMVEGYQKAALQTRLAIPIIYGVDAVHGHNNLRGAVIFPHNIGLGAAGDEQLVERIAAATAKEMVATAIYWNYAPVLAVPQDIRWGRTYESFGEQTGLVTRLGTAYLRGLQGQNLSEPNAVLATPKHYLGDGGTAWGSPTTNNYKLDQGVTAIDEETLRRVHLPPYAAAVEAGARSIMVSFSSWDGQRMSAQQYLLTDVLKGELGFSGFIVSDWGSVDMVDRDYSKAVIASINAGIDMNMVPYDYTRFIKTLKSAVDQGDVTMERIDDAVLRILTVKFELGLFEHPLGKSNGTNLVGAQAHRDLAREAVAKSLVLLKNDAQALPLAKDLPLILVGGAAADDIGLQSGGWTIEWQGKTGSITPGTTVLQGIAAAVSAGTQVEYDPTARFEKLRDAAGQPQRAAVGIAVVGEKPYAEGVGDSNNLGLNPGDTAVIQRLRERADQLIVIIISGRPMMINEILPDADALVAAWLPGTEGDGITEVLFGDTDFTGRLSFSWPRSMDQLPLDLENPGQGCDGPLFPVGYGLTYASENQPAPVMLTCP